MKERFLHLLFLTGICTTLNAQPGNWSWAKRAGGTPSDFGKAISVDSNGNSFVAGSFNSASITFGSTVLINTDNGGTSRDLFIVKYDLLGNVVWAKSAGGTAEDEANGICVDVNGNIFVTGHFYSPAITFGGTTLFNPVTNGSSCDIFIVKYDALGNVVWAKGAGGIAEDAGSGIGADQNGNAYLIGTFYSSSITFGSTILTNADNSGSTRDLFIIKYDGSGTVAWAKGYGDALDDLGQAISVDASGNSFMTGNFESTSIAFGSYTLTNAGARDFFITKHSSSGNVDWARGAGGTIREFGISVSHDTGGNSYVTGTFESPSVVFGTTTLTNVGVKNIFVVKYSTLGNVIWAKSAGGTSSDFSYGITADASGNSYVTGKFYSSSLSFGSATLTNTGVNTADIFVFKLDPSGNGAWGQIAGGTGGFNDETASSIDVDALGNPIITGFYSCPTIAFGNDTLTNTSAFYDLFVSKLSSICNLSPPNICLATVDSISKYNHIVWDKTAFTNVDSFIIHREISLNNYQPIGAVSYDSLSLFVDTVKTKYFPNTGDPNAGTYRYKLQLRDTCGNYTMLSPFHNTIFMTNSSGSFSWPQLYTIEGSPNPVNSYVLMRDNLNDGNWVAVNSVAGTQQTVVDPAYATWAATANWRIETIWNITCTPSIKDNPQLMAITKTRSNSYKTFVTGTGNNENKKDVSVYPNPSTGSFVIEGPNLENREIQISNVLGKIIYSETIHTAGPLSLGLEVPDGIYFLKLNSTLGNAVKKLIIAH